MKLIPIDNASYNELASVAKTEGYDERGGLLAAYVYGDNTTLKAKKAVTKALKTEFGYTHINVTNPNWIDGYPDFHSKFR